jgi:hypothetical protein
MLALEFFTWWYSQGWSLLVHNAKHRLVRTSHLFSLPVLIRTLFAPWKRITTQPGAGLEAHVQAATDNFVSRCIGFVVRMHRYGHCSIADYSLAIITTSSVSLYC